MKPQDKARHLRPLIERAAVSLPDEDALEAVELFPAWQSGIGYTVDERVRYGETLYRCIQAHTSQDNWTPNVVPALFTEVTAPGEIEVWKQPAGAHDAYNKGAKVHYPDEAGPIYESLIDGNIYSPEAYPAGWRQL